MGLKNLLEIFKGHDKVIFRLTGLGETEYSTVEFKDAIDTIEALQQENADWQKRYEELDAGHSKLYKAYCEIKQENEQLQAKADGRGKVVHGKWISEEVCSACNFDICDMLSGDLEGVRFETPDYCPNCGAKMDGEAAEKAIAVIGGGMNG